MSGQKKTIVWQVLIVIVVVSTAIVFVRARPGRSAPSSHDSKDVGPPNESGVRRDWLGEARSQPDPQGASARGPVQNVRFILYASGIHPHELRAREGLVAIEIEDRSGTSAGLVIERENSSGRAQIGQIRRFQNHWRGRGQLQLEPGRYRVYDASQTNNQAALIIEP